MVAVLAPLSDMLTRTRDLCNIEVPGVRRLHTTPFPRQRHAQSGQVDWMRVEQSADAATSNSLPVHPSVRYFATRAVGCMTVH